MQVVLFGQITLTVTLLVLLSCITLVLIDFTNIIMLVSRAIVVFILFEAIRNQHAGFAEVDLKPMNDTITLIVIHALLLYTVNMKIELLVTCPVAFICIYISLQSAFVDDGQNMSCYMQAEETIENIFVNTLIMMIVVIFAIHDQRKNQIRHFIAQERAKKQ